MPSKLIADADCDLTPWENINNAAKTISGSFTCLRILAEVGAKTLHNTFEPFWDRVGCIFNKFRLLNNNHPQAAYSLQIPSF